MRATVLFRSAGRPHNPARCLALSAALALGAAPAAAATAPATSASATIDIPLPEIPELPALAPSAPKTASVQALSGRLEELAQVRVDDPLAPPALPMVDKDLDPDLVPAIAQRLQELRGELDADAVVKLLERARKLGREAQREKRKQDKNAKIGEDDGDWLAFMLALDRRDDAAWRDAVELYGMLRMLERMGTTPAAREMVNCYAYFGEIVRIDLQRGFVRMKDRAVPALLEAKENEAQKVRRWATRQLDALGRAIPGEAVQTTDAEILADVLRAFGRIRDVEAAGVILSFCNSDRVQLRNAARAAIGAIGEPAAWQLRDAYEGLTGNKPPREWDWKRTARELFRLHDRARLASVHQLMDDGLAAYGDKRYADAASAFDQVLARAPLFERRREMAPSYAARAAELAGEGKADDAIVLLRKALRLDPEAAQRDALESRLAVLEAAQLIERGTPDRSLLKRALELDPKNEDAQKLLASLDDASEQRQSRTQRHAAALGIGLAAAVALILLAHKPRRKIPTSG